jgi:hypothetical protein
MMEVSATERRTSALTIDSRENVRRECEKLGELVVQAKLESGHFGTGEAFAWEWLLEQHHRRLREGESAERERAERIFKAAEDSASAARAAAAGAQAAARWTIVAALAAAAAVIVSLAKYW